MDKAPAIKIAPVKAPARLLGERKSSGSRLEPAPELEVPKIIQGRRGSVLAAPPPDESARRASLLISEKKLRPGEVAEDKKGRKPSILAKDLQEIINKESTPLKDVGPAGPPQIVDMYDSYSAVEGDTGYISVQVQGTPAPTFKFYFKGTIPLLEGVRYKFHTDGTTNTITLCMRNCKPSDEGKYKIVITNPNGTVTDETQLYVSKPGCTDFRALLRKSKYAKWAKDKGDPNWGDLKGVEKAKDTFLSPLQDKTAKEGKDKKVEFEAKFSKPNAKAKWFCRKNELFMGIKYKFSNSGDTYGLTILNPKLEDTANYSIDIGGVTSTAKLTVEAPDPSYRFIKPLNKTYNGYTKHELTLECTVSDPIAIVSWYKGDKKLTSDAKYTIDKDLAGVCSLHIKSCALDDTGDYRCQLERQPDKTETKVKVVEYQYKFVKCLKSQQNVEKDTITLACELDDPLGDVQWFKDGKEIKPDGNRVQIVKDGKKRKLIIKDAKLADGGNYSCASNADKTNADVIVKKQNKFNKGLKDATGVEREKLVLDVELEDDTAPLEWKLNGKTIKPSDRVEIKNLGGGKHQLIFNKLKPTDAGEITAHSGPLTSTCKLTVQKGESKPQINAPKEFEGPINAPLIIEVPYKIDGKKQTPIEAALLKDGKPLKDVEVEVKDDKVIFKIKKPTRDQTGPYQIKLSNGQGEDVKDVKITMQDVPNAPQDVNVRDVFEKSCIIDWKPPKDNGGTPLQKYIIERQDLSAKKPTWDSVGEVPADKPTTFKVDDLTPKKQYKFRIRAVNKVGPSEPAEFKNTVLAKNPWDEPGKPKNLEVTDWDKDHADLKWTKPDSDGGAEITEYEIEVKDKNSKDWVKKKRVPASQTSTTVPDLKEGNTYEFRVRAVNKAGPGEPSDATKPIVAKSRFVKPFITGDQLKPIIIKVGQQFKYEVKYGGEPEPAVKWEKDGKEIVADGKRITIEKAGGKTILTVRDGVRSDSGKYKLILTNSSGTVDTIGEVIVLGKPTPPKGPLVPEEIRGKHIKVKWQKPEDNGGTDLTGYVLEKMEEGGKWAPAGECGPNDESFTFKDLTPKKKYKLRVRAKNKEGVSEPLETTESILAKDPWDEPGKPKNLEVTDWDKDHADLKWTKPDSDGGAEITEYEIEVKDKNSKDWVKKKRVPASQTSTTVPDLKEGNTYEFRVRAVNKAGPGEPSDATKPIVAKCRFVKPFITGDQLKTLIIKKGQQVKYEIKFGGEPEPEVKWEKDGKELVADGKRITIEKPGGKTILTVKDGVRSDSGKYKLILTNSSGTIDTVGEVIVLDKPSPPKGPLVPEEVRAKHIKVKWQKPEDNGGSDLTGYVLEKLEEGGKWAPAGECGPNEESFTFKGLTPNKKYKLRVRAKNKEGVSEPLETSEAILAKNPFDEPSKPGKPEIVDYDNKSVTLEWKKPEKDGGRPVTHYTVEMKSKDKPDWVEVLKTTDDKCKAVVDGLKEGASYEFRVKAHNEGGPSEASEPTGKHVCKYKNLKPLIDRKTFKSLTVKAGNTHTWQVDVAGEPAPEYKWWFGDAPLTSKDRIKIENKEYRTNFSIANVQRGDRGKYKLKATNVSGSDEEIVDLVVLAPPTQPRGPLEATEVNDKGCKLKWKRPEDDGGAPIRAYKIEKRDTKCAIPGKWDPAGKITISGQDSKEDLEFAITGLTPNAEYEFRVTAVNDEGESKPLKTENPIIAKKPASGASKPKNVEVTDWDKDHADIKWTKPDKDGGAKITEYEIEVRETTSKEWVKKKRVPASEATTTIDGLKEGKEYEFRVRAINKAGSGEPSDATKPIVAKSRNVKPFITGDQLPKKITIKKGETFKYDIAYGGEPAPEAKWQKGGKDVPADGKRVTIEKPGGNKTVLVVRNAVRGDSGKYHLILKNASGTTESIGEVVVLDKPSAPNGPLDVTDVTETGCKLHWDQPDDNGGTPIKQYKIEKLDTKTGKWSEITKVSADKTTYTVTGLEPGPEYKFRVSAVNDEGESDSLVTENWTITKKTTVTVSEVEYKKKPGQAGAEVGVEQYTTEKKDISGDLETNTKTTVTTTTTKNQIQDGNRTRTQTRTVKRIVTKTTTAEREYEY